MTSHRTRGFTLIELAVTLLILALAAAVAAPSVARGVDTVRARTEAAGIATFLRAAHERAVTQHRPYEVRVRSEEGFIESCNTTFGQVGLDLGELLATGVQRSTNALKFGESTGGGSGAFVSHSMKARSTKQRS